MLLLRIRRIASATCLVSSPSAWVRSSQATEFSMNFCCSSVHGGSVAKPSTVEIARTTLAIGSVFISARFSTLIARRIDGESPPNTSISGNASSRVRTKSPALEDTVPLACPKRIKTVFPSSGRIRMPCKSGPIRVSGFRPPLLCSISGLTHDTVRSSPGSPASTPTRAHNPARCAARRSFSPNFLCVICRLESATSHHQPGRL